jgi:hypothetical protein
MKNITPAPSRPAKVRNGLRTRRAARAASTRLERELSSYTSPAELKELDAILQRHTEEETADIRRILAARAAGRSDG